MNEQLEQLETQLDNMPLIKRVGVYAFLFIAILYGGWSFFGEEISDKIIAKEDAIALLEQKNKKNNIKSLEQMIKKTKKESLALEDDIVNLHFKEQFVRGRLESLDFIYFNDMGIAMILDGILKNSLKYNIDIKIIQYKDKEIDYAAHIEEREQIEISGDGSFKNIMQLLQYIDSINALLELRGINIDISDDEITNFELKISHYGVEL